MTITRIHASEVTWPEPVAIAPERVLDGSPTASTIVLQDGGSYQVGLWRVSEGSFVTDHAGYLEYIHILDGSGQLVDDNGIVTHLEGGTTVLMQPGWKGRWVVEKTITKTYTTVNS